MGPASQIHTSHYPIISLSRPLCPLRPVQFPELLHAALHKNAPLQKIFILHLLFRQYRIIFIISARRAPGAVRLTNYGD